MLTRRQVLELGAVAWLTAIVGGAGSSSAARVDTSAPDWLRRASWVPLSGATVRVAGTTLQLTEVADLPLLQGRDDAFRLELTGSAGAVTGGIHRFQHPALGRFELFLSPVDTVVAGVQRYEVVVNRSIGVPRAVSPLPSPAPAKREATAPPAPATPHHGRRKRRRGRHPNAVRPGTLGAARHRATRGQAKIAS